MSLPIITAVRQIRELKQSVRDTAVELAHRCSIYGVVRVSNSYMAEKCHHHQRTFQRHVIRLQDMHILKKKITKRVVKIKVGDRMEERFRNEINVYTFTIPWNKTIGSRLPIDKMPSNLPHPEREKKATLHEETKEGSLRQELANQKRMLPILYTPGTDQWNKTCEEIARLEGLLAQGGE
jgi:hypothetical protein